MLGAIAACSNPDHNHELKCALKAEGWSLVQCKYFIISKYSRYLLYQKQNRPQFSQQLHVRPPFSPRVNMANHHLFSV
jgi:hypothetical protein